MVSGDSKMESLACKLELNKIQHRDCFGMWLERYKRMVMKKKLLFLTFLHEGQVFLLI